MFLVVTRNFPPDVGGMQILMGGLSEGLLNHGLVKVFTFEYPNIERVKGIKLFRKYRKANLVNNFINENPNIRAIITDHWKSLELLNEVYLNRFKTICLLHSKEINHDKGSRSNKRVLNVLNNVDHIVANSKFTKNLAIENGVNSDKITVINPYLSLRYPLMPWFGFDLSLGYNLTLYDPNGWEANGGPLAGKQELGLSQPFFRISLLFGG